MYEQAKIMTGILISELTKLGRNIQFECLFDESDKSIIVSHNYKNYENDEIFLERMVELVDDLYYNKGFYEISITYDRNMQMRKEIFSASDKYPVKSNNLLGSREYAIFPICDNLCVA